MDSEENKVVSYEEKINNLEKRVAYLEKLEKDRRRKKIIITCIKLAIYIGIIISIVLLLRQLKPYFEQINDIKSVLNGGSSNSFDINSYLQGILGY